MSSIKDNKSYFQGKINGLREAMVLIDKNDYSTQQAIQARIIEYEEVLNGTYKD